MEFIVIFDFGTPTQSVLSTEENQIAVFSSYPKAKKEAEEDSEHQTFDVFAKCDPNRNY